MKREIISNAVTNISDRHITEAAEYARKGKQKRRKTIWMRLGAVAACLCLIVGIVVWKNQPSSPKQTEIIVDENGVTIPRLEISVSKNSAADMIAFFIYQGRVYVQDEFLDNAEGLVGEYLGTSKGGIDEWTNKENYIELSGSARGDFYAVNGYDPTFMLCMQYEDGSVATFVNDNGITLKNGADLFEERLHLAGNYESVMFQTRYDWYYSVGEPVSLEGSSEQVNAFISALNMAEFMRLEDIPLGEGETSIYDDKEIYHLFFHMENGMVIHLRLFEGGYVKFDGINGVCVKMEESAFNDFIKVLESQQ